MHHGGRKGPFFRGRIEEEEEEVETMPLRAFDPLLRPTT